MVGLQGHDGKQTANDFWLEREQSAMVKILKERQNSIIFSTHEWQIFNLIDRLMFSSISAISWHENLFIH